MLNDEFPNTFSKPKSNETGKSIENIFFIK